MHRTESSSYNKPTQRAGIHQSISNFTSYNKKILCYMLEGTVSHVYINPKEMLFHSCGKEGS